MRQLCLVIVFFSIFWKEATCDYPYHVPIKCANDSCSECYSTLVKELLQDERNYLTLQKTFFPPSSTSPVFLEVLYQYDNDTDCEDDDDNDYPCTFFWSSSVYFFFHPVRVFQYTSLLFSNPSLRYDEIVLYLPEECRYANNNSIILLTQRLKLYAMHQEITPPIDDTYTAYSHSVSSIKNWYSEHEVVGILAVASQLILPTVVTLFVFIFFVFVLELEPHGFGDKIEKELKSGIDKIKTYAQARLLTYVTFSIVFQALTLAADIAALCQYGENALPKEVHKYYFSSDSPRYFWSVPITMILFDTFLLVLFLVVVPIISCCKGKMHILIYSLIIPFGCIASHSYHIIFAFIHDPYHATSILLLYALVAFLHIQGFRKFFYCIRACTSRSGCCKSCWKPCDSRNEHSGSCCQNCSSCCKRFCCSIYFWTILLYIIIPFVLMGGSIGLSLALVIELPISNALDEAPNRLYVIYQASVTFFAAVIAFQLLFRQRNTIFSVIVKAVNTSIEDTEKGTKGAEKSIEIKDAEKQNSTTLHPITQLVNKEEWKTMSEKEKEFLVANMVLSHYLNNNASTDDPQPGRGSVRQSLLSDPPRQRHQPPPRQPPQLTQQPEHASSGCCWITSSCCNNYRQQSRGQEEGTPLPHGSHPRGSPSHETSPRGSPKSDHGSGNTVAEVYGDTEHLIHGHN